jgi:hypothetical protein
VRGRVVGEDTREAVPFRTFGGQVQFKGFEERALGLAVGVVVRVRRIGEQASAGFLRVATMQIWEVLKSVSEF